MARLTTQTDVDTYNTAIIADGVTPMQVDDVIFFRSDANAQGALFNKTEWTGARLGATIWIEGGVASYDGIDIGIQTSGLVTVQTNASNPCHIHFFGGQGEILRNAGNLAGREFQVYNIDYLIIDNETHSNPGLRDGWGSGRTSTFGMKVANIVKDDGCMALKVDHTGKTMKRLEIRGCELTMGSFAKIRAILSENHIDKFVIERNLITRSIGGEGLYIGQTSKIGTDEWNSLQNFYVRNNIFAFTAAEALQLQQLANGARVYNNVVYISGTDFKAPFQAFQDTGIQLDLIQGDVHFFNNIVYGHGSVGIQVFAKDGSGQGVAWGNKRPKIYNNLISGAKEGMAFRMHNSFLYGPGIEFRDNDVAEPQRGLYDEISDADNFYVEIGSAIVPPVHIIGGNAPNDAFPFLNPGTTASLKSLFNLTRSDVPLPEFINTGFDGIDVHNISIWSELYNVGRYWGYTKGTAAAPDSNNIVDMDALGTTYTFPHMFHTNLDWIVGDNVFVKNNGDSTKSFYAKISAYTGASVSFNNITNKQGTGVSEAKDRWNISKFRQYTTDHFVWLAEDGTSLDYNLYKCLSAHEAVIGDPEARRPDQSAIHWEIVQWDANGKNMYDPLYNGTPVTTDFMEVAGDFRLVKGSYHHLKGRGLLCNEQRDDFTRYGWQWKDSIDGTIRDIPGAYSYKLILEEHSYLTPGRYYRFWVEKLNGASEFQPRLTSEWEQV